MNYTAVSYTHLSSVTGTTSEIVDGVKKAQKSGARVIGFIDVATAELAKLVDYVITYPCLLYTSQRLSSNKSVQGSDVLCP